MYELILLSDASNDVQIAYNWYESQSFGLGDEFILCIDSVLDNISKEPLIYQKIYKNFRRSFVSRFPYCIFFIKEDKHIQILSIFHAHKDPVKLKYRIR